jgi:hypothetical protein
MSTPDWRQLGFLTPDAMEAQQDVWALQARLRTALANVMTDLAARTAEPTWGASLEEAGQRAHGLAADLLSEAGEGARLRVEDDEIVREFDSALDEVITSGHVPSLVTTGYAVLGELAPLPVRLLDDLAGPHARLLTGRIVGDESHHILGRLMPVMQPSPRDKDNLRRLLRHLYTRLYSVYGSWRQTFHSLGIDGETLAEECTVTIRKAHTTLEFKVTTADVKMFRA